MPKGWVYIPLENLFMVIGGGTPSTSVDSYWNETGVPWFSSADIDNNGDISIRRHVTKQGLANSTTSVVPKGSIIVVTRVGLGKVALLKEDMCFSQDSQALLPNVPNMLNNKYVFYCLRHAMQSIKYSGRGTTISGITKKQLADYHFPLPPQVEQHRIVAKIDALFSKLDKGVDTLQTIRQQLRMYRHSVLKLAYDGTLTHSHYMFATTGSLTEEIRIGPFGTLLHKGDYIKNGIPVINPKHMKGYRIEPDNAVCISNEKAVELSSYALFENDVLLARRGEMGRTAYVTTKEAGWICGTGSMIIRFPIKSYGRLFALLLSSQRIRKYLKNNCSGTTMSNLNEKIVKRILLPLISVREQERLLSAIDSRLSVCDKLEQLVDESIAKAGALRQSILKKAFAGKLVPQDPDDEPASKLLERIKAEQLCNNPRRLQAAPPSEKGAAF